MRRLWNRTSRRIGSSLVVVVLTLCGLAAPAAATDQVPFNAEGTAVITAVTHLPGGLTQLTGSTSGNATHLGDFTGPITRIQDHQGNFGSTAVFVGANGTDETGSDPLKRPETTALHSLLLWFPGCSCCS